MIKQLTEDQIKEQLGTLKGMTVRFNQIHSAQHLQLQMWPMIAFPFALSSEAEVNTDNKSVLFKIKTNQDEPKGSSHERAKGYVIMWVRSILWDDTFVSFRFEKNVKKRTNSIKSRRSKNSKRV